LLRTGATPKEAYLTGCFIFYPHFRAMNQIVLMRGKRLRVNEIFHSIQGESSFAGFPCVFVRMTGCNLRCSYCDTQYAYDEGEELSSDEIIKRVKRYGCSLVEITGGEPLLQKDTPLLISALLDEGFRVLLETNGSLDISPVDVRCVRIIDVKLPSSGEAERNNLKNLSQLRDRDELKFVIGRQNDYDYAKEILQLIPVDVLDKITINFSPVFGSMEPNTLAGWILNDHLHVRLNLQLQKIIWLEATRGF